LQEATVGGMRRFAVVASLLDAVTFMLVIACANVANMTLTVLSF
jgi:hypothetical protein